MEIWQKVTSAETFYTYTVEYEQNFLHNNLKRKISNAFWYLHSVSNLIVEELAQKKIFFSWSFFWEIVAKIFLLIMGSDPHFFLEIKIDSLSFIWIWADVKFQQKF